MLKREEFAKGMGQRLNINNAAAKDARIKLSREESALGMGQRSSDVAVKGARIKLRKEECA